MSSLTGALMLWAALSPTLTFDTDPMQRADAIVDGEMEGRVTWQLDAPAFPGDTPGSLNARYLSTGSSARLGFTLDEALDEDDPFTAFAVFRILSEGYFADPNGFSQVSWGLWNSAETGMERVAYGPDADAFELVEFDWFPNVSPFFGGPYLSPALFGAADLENPLYPFAGAYANATFGFGPPAPLPLDTPLVALMEHRPDAGVVVVSVLELRPGPVTVPVPGAVAVMSASALSRAEFSFDTLGLTLWQDPFAGESPSIDVTLEYHALGVKRGTLSLR